MTSQKMARKVHKYHFAKIFMVIFVISIKKRTKIAAKRTNIPKSTFFSGDSSMHVSAPHANTQEHDDSPAPFT